MKPLIYILLAGIGIVSCTSAPKHLAKAIEKDKPYVAAETRKLWPCAQSDTIIKLDTLYDFVEVQCPDSIRYVTDSFETSHAVRVPVYVKAPVIRVKETVTIRIEDSAKIYLMLNNNEVLQGINDDLAADNKKKTDSRDWWRKWCLITWGILGLGGIGWVLLKKFKPL